MTRPVRLLLVVASGLAVLGASLLAGALLMPRPRTSEAARPTGPIGGPFTLTAADGKTVSDQSYRGKWMLVYFGYTSCPDACPTALNDMGVALDRLGGEAGALQPIFITVDPNRATREKLAEYLRSFDPRIVALTGSADQIAAVAKDTRSTTRPSPATERTISSTTARTSMWSIRTENSLTQWRAIFPATASRRGSTI